MSLLPKYPGTGRRLNVDWADRAWTPRIVIGPAATHSGFWFQSSDAGSRAALPSGQGKLKAKSYLRQRRSSRGFTLIEMLVVIAIIGILAALLLPVLAKTKGTTKIKQAKMDMKNLETAVGQYDVEYSRFPGFSPNGKDFTYGYLNGVNSAATNSDLMSILMDLNTGINANHAKNPHNDVLYNAKQFSDVTSSGFSTIDNQLRDPWGHPYVITMDFDGDGYCQDAFYGNKVVANPSGAGTQGLFGLSDYYNNGAYELRGSVMIWSLGPDGQLDPSSAANTSSNLDNVLSWQ